MSDLDIAIAESAAKTWPGLPPLFRAWRDRGGEKSELVQMVTGSHQSQEAQQCRLAMLALIDYVWIQEDGSLQEYA